MVLVMKMEDGVTVANVFTVADEDRGWRDAIASEDKWMMEDSDRLEDAVGPRIVTSVKRLAA